jgi:hypothetical protein
VTAEWLRQSIQQQRQFVEQALNRPLRELSKRCTRVWFNDERLNAVLQESLSTMPLCGLIYAVDVDGYQRSANVSSLEIDLSCKGQDLSDRPYLVTSSSFTGMVLSDVYLNSMNSRPCITALQSVSSVSKPLGFIAADFELHKLPGMSIPEPEYAEWRQIRGDPMIRGALFSQAHVDSPMDRQIGSVVAVIEDLICERGVFHVKIHYSSSRATFWRIDKPFHYRVHVLDEILNPSMCLAYPVMPYTGDAVVLRQSVRNVLERFSLLRFIDDSVYLRNASLNVINGMVGLTFSCDGTHYMTVDEFMARGPEFWSDGSVATDASTIHSS